MPWTGFTLPSLIENRNLIDVTFCSSPCFFHRKPAVSSPTALSHLSRDTNRCQLPWLSDQLGLESLVKLGPKINFSPEARPLTSLWFSLSWRWEDTFRILHMLHVDATPLLVVAAPPPAVARFFRSLAARQGRCQPHFSVLDWDFSKLFELNEMVIQQKMRWVLQLDMNLMAKSPCLIEFNIYKDQKRCEYTSKCLVHARQDFRFVHPDDYASKPNFSQSGCPNPTLPHRVAIFTSLGSHDSTSFSLSSLPALPKFLFLTWVWLFVWVNKKIIKQKIPSHQPFDLSINSHVSQLPATSNHVTRYKSRSVGVTLSWSRETCHGSSLWTKPTTRSGFKAWTVLGLQKYVSITE